MIKTPANSFPYPEKLKLLMKAIQELLLIDHAGKKEFRSEAAPELQKGKGAFTFSECYSMLCQIGGGEQLLASLEAGRSLMLDGALVYIKKQDVLDPEFEFSEDTQQFESEFTVLLILFYNSVKATRDPSSGGIIYPEFSREDNGKFDFAIMKALFQAGKIIERLQSDGWQGSDWGKETGSVKHKGYVLDQDVIQAAKEVSKRLKSKRSIARAVRKRLLKDELGKENPKKVYKEDHIRQKILNEVWPEIL